MIRPRLLLLPIACRLLRRIYEFIHIEAKGTNTIGTYSMTCNMPVV